MLQVDTQVQWYICVCVFSACGVNYYFIQDDEEEGSSGKKKTVKRKFYTGQRPQAKRIWKNAVEQHVFFQ